MSKINAQVDSCIEKAVVFLRKYRNMAIPVAMKLVNFTPQKCGCISKYMWVYCWAKKRSKQGNASFTLPTMSIAVFGLMTVVALGMALGMALAVAVTTVE